MAAVLPSTRIEIPVGEFGRTWRDDIFEMKVLIQSPEKAYLDKYYYSELVPFGRDGIDVGFGMRRFDGYLIFFLNFRRNDLSHQNPMPIVYDFTVLRDNPESKDVSYERATDVAENGSYMRRHSHVWVQMPKIMSEKELFDRAKLFQSAQKALADVRGSMEGHDLTLVADDSPPPTYSMRGSLMIRSISAKEWADPSQQRKLIEDPDLFLYSGGSSLVGSMAKVLEEADESGDVVFIVGQSATKLRAHSVIVCAATPVKIFCGDMQDGIIKEVRLAQFKVQAFRVVLMFMYTHTVTDADLEDHALELMEIADLYQLKHLHEKCEKYLCCEFQTISQMNSIPSLLMKADLYRALTLKAMCFEWINKRGSDHIEGPDFEALPQPLLLELFRDCNVMGLRLKSEDPEAKRRKQAENCGASRLE